MKRKLQLFTVLITLGFSSYCQQLDELSFEDWTNIAGCVTIDSAKNFTFLDLERYRIQSQCSATPGVSQTTDKYEGTYAMKLVATNLSGTLFSTEANLASSLGGSTVPFTSNPVSLRGHYKFTKAGTDTVGIIVKTLVGGIEKGVGTFKATASTSGFQSFEIPITYVDGSTTEEVYLQISLGNSNGEADPGSELIVDAFEFNYTPLALTDLKENSGVSIYAVDKEVRFSEPVSNVTIYNVQGVNQVTYNGTVESLQTKSLNSGLYVLTFKYKGELYRQKVLID